MLDPIVRSPAACSRAGKSARQPLRRAGRGAWARMALAAGLLARLALALALTLTLTLTPALLAQKPQATSPPSSKPQAAQPARDLPPRALAAERFLAARGVAPGHRTLARSLSIRSSLGRSFHPPHGGAGRSHAGPGFQFSDLDAARSHGRQHFRFQPGHRPHHLHCDRSVGHDRQPRLHRRHRWRGVEFEQCRRLHGLEHRLQPADRCGHRIWQHPGRLHQHRRGHRAAGWDGSDSGRHRRPQRRSRLLLRGRHPALDRRRKHLEPDRAKLGCAIRGLDELLLCRRGFCRICMEHRQSAWSWWQPSPGSYEGDVVDANLPAAQLRRPLLLDRQRGHLAPGHHQRRQRQNGAVGRRRRCSGPTATRPRLWFGTPCANCSSPPSAFTAITLLPTA